MPLAEPVPWKPKPVLAPAAMLAFQLALENTVPLTLEFQALVTLAEDTFAVTFHPLMEELPAVTLTSRVKPLFQSLEFDTAAVQLLEPAGTLALLVVTRGAVVVTRGAVVVTRGAVVVGFGATVVPLMVVVEPMTVTETLPPELLDEIVEEPEQFTVMFELPLLW
jgi:hypothetical protein